MRPSKEYHIRLQQLQNQRLQKYTGPFQSNQGGRHQVLPQRQNNHWFKARKPQLPVNQMYRRKIPPYQNSQKIRKQKPKFNIPGSQAPQIRNIPKAKMIQNVRRQFPHAQGISNVRRPFPQSLLNQNTQRRLPQAQMNQNIQRRVSQALINQNLRRRFPQTEINNIFKGQFPHTQVNQKFQGRVLRAQGNQNVRIPHTPPFRGIPNQTRSRNIRQRTLQMPIKIFTLQELLQLAPRNDKKLWEWIISRLPASYTIPDAKFIHLYQAFNKQKR